MTAAAGGETPYRGLLRRPAVARALTGALVGRLPTGMTALGARAAAARGQRQLGLVGLATAIDGVGAVLGGPVLARLVDRRGQTLVLAATATVAGLAFVALALVPAQRTGAVLAAAAVAGLATPPLEPALRALWPSLVGPANLQRAYGLDAASQELVFVTGPLVVAVSAAAASPAAAMMVAAVLGALGTALLASTAHSRRWRSEHRAGGLLGALRSRGVVSSSAASPGPAAPSAA